MLSDPQQNVQFVDLRVVESVKSYDNGQLQEQSKNKNSCDDRKRTASA